MSVIKRPAEITGKETIAALIYGQPGMGKTTLACSAPSPVLFDFDGGVARIRDEHQVPTVQIASWEDALAALEEVKNDGGEFKTIVVDTASKMLDCIISNVCGTAQPQLKHWGIINAHFKSFLRSIRDCGKNMVFVAQRETEKDGENNRYVPQFRASNYKDVICDLDVCGYMEMVNIKGQEVRQITFNPSSRNEGKNTAEFAPAYIIPTLAPGQPNTFLTDRFREYVNMQREKAAKRQAMAKQVAELLDKFMPEIAAADDALSINTIVEAVSKEKPTGDARLRIAKAINQKAAELGLTYNKEAKLYE